MYGKFLMAFERNAWERYAMRRNRHASQVFMEIRTFYINYKWVEELELYTENYEHYGITLNSCMVVIFCSCMVFVFIRVVE